MFVGHYGPSFAAKGIRESILLWVLFIAVQVLDVFWSIFVLLGIEKVRIIPGNHSHQSTRSLLHVVHLSAAGLHALPPMLLLRLSSLKRLTGPSTVRRRQVETASSSRGQAPAAL